MMKVLMISADPRVLRPDTDAARRMRKYAELFDALDIVVLSRAHGEDRRDGNLFVYAAGASFWPARLYLAWRVCIASVVGARCDVVTAQGADETGIVAWLVARRFGVPFQLQIHTDVMSPRYRRAGWKEYCRYRIARFLVPRAGCLRVVSRRIALSLADAGLVGDTSRVAVLPIFTDVRRYADTPENPETVKRFSGHDFKIIAVGRFVDKEKNFSMLIEAMVTFIRACPRALLVIVGDGPDEGRYRSLIAGNHLEQHIVIEPWRDDLASFLKSFDLFVSPSDYEGWGRAVIEAMAAGLAVITTDTGLAGEVVKNGENGIVVPVGDVRAMSAALAATHRDPAMRSRIADRGRETALGLPPKTKDEYLALYKKSFESCPR